MRADGRSWAGQERIAARRGVDRLAVHDNTLSVVSPASARVALPTELHG